MLRHLLGLFERSGDAVLRLGQFQLLEQGLEFFPVFGDIDAFGSGADDGRPGLLQGHREVQGGLAAELDDHAVGFLPFHDVEHILQGQRLEVELVGGVVVGAHRLGVAVHHDRLVAELLQGEGRVDAAVVELYALPDPVRSAAEDHDLLLVRVARLVLRLVGRVVIRRVGLELGRARIDELEDALYAVLDAPLPHLFLADAEDRPQLPVRIAVPLRLPHQLDRAWRSAGRRAGGRSCRPQALFRSRRSPRYS